MRISDWSSDVCSSDLSINRGDQLILRDYLRSVDMVKKLDKELNLSAHYSDHQIDPFSRLASDATMEELRDYYLSRVSIESDDYTGVLIIQSEGFDPKMYQYLTSYSVHEGASLDRKTAHTGKK